MVFCACWCRGGGAGQGRRVRLPHDEFFGGAVGEACHIDAGWQGAAMRQVGVHACCYLYARKRIDVAHHVGLVGSVFDGANACWGIFLEFLELRPRIHLLILVAGAIGHTQSGIGEYVGVENIAKCWWHVGPAHIHGGDILSTGESVVGNAI